MRKTYSDQNILIDSVLNEIFIISLEVIAATGYTWNPEFDEAMIVLVNRETFPILSTVGGSAKEIFTFQAKKAGTTQIVMKYGREWETAPRKTKSFEVRISQEVV